MVLQLRLQFQSMFVGIFRLLSSSPRSPCIKQSVLLHVVHPVPLFIFWKLQPLLRIRCSYLDGIVLPSCSRLCWLYVCLRLFQPVRSRMCLQPSKKATQNSLLKKGYRYKKRLLWNVLWTTLCNLIKTRKSCFNVKTQLLKSLHKFILTTQT